MTKTSDGRESWLVRERNSWFNNIIGDLWGGAVTTFALLPEVVGFMIVAGVPPYMGLYTTIILTITLAFAGGQPGVISAGAGATATIAAGLIAVYFRDNPEYLFAAVTLQGIIQIILGLCRVGSLVKYIPTCVMHGFVNGLAIIIFLSQVKLMINAAGVETFILIAIGIGIIVGFPFLKKVLPFLSRIPENFVALFLITAYTMIFQRHDVMTISSIGAIKPSFDYIGKLFVGLPNIFTLDCVTAIAPTAVSLAFVGLIETMLTSRMVAEETKFKGNLNRECIGQGIGNGLNGILGAMPGCAMIAMTVTNLRSGGKGRLSSFVAGSLMAVLLFALSFVLESIPLAALVAIMYVVCFHTFNWGSVFKSARVPLEETVVMGTVVCIVFATDNLAYGVGAGLAIFSLIYICRRFIPNKNILWMIGFACAAVGAGICFFHPILTLAGWIISAFGIGVAGAGRRLLQGTPKLIALIAVICSAVVCVGIMVLIFLGSSPMSIFDTHFSPFVQNVPWFTLEHSVLNLG